ncbi:MAG TPA: hypothetical protein PLO67_04565 [Saprospiraceae bacterium]|nr:hypothetical protein [Saprospiraceae bacterium]HPI05960.1 hypothetical protein [Saprospiraceae bacterium]
MHNIGRTVRETYETNYETNFENEHEHGQSEFETDTSGEFEDNWSREYETDEYEMYESAGSNSPFNEMTEMELASELLEVQNEEEFRRFLGKLTSKAAPQGAPRNFGQSGAGKMLGGVLKRIAKTALPLAGRIAGGFFGGPIGAKIGSTVGNFASKAFGLELEGLSPEDKEFALSQALVRFSGAAARNVQSDPKARNKPAQAVREGVVRAAQQYAPGLLNPMPGAYRKIRNKGVYDHRDYETTGGYVAQEF